MLMSLLKCLTMILCLDLFKHLLLKILFFWILQNKKKLKSKKLMTLNNFST